ncbi:KIR protein [Plasmodium coatneyi]|uniref:KIR protein n=1 Tax=Plasmodium coatneyi TaxID=208452 RepID=A0A1B1DSQ2_9APIC|nr:KIR protein [Plasmodium coatneyi]ANQ05772.1 KIR protein [Plasmodium coatneyi]
MSEQKGPLGVDALEQLPSKQKYNKFDTGNESLVEDGPECKWEEKKAALKNALTSALSSYEDLQEHIDNIAKAWCKVINGAEDQSEGGKKVGGELYYLFYYWLGDKVWNTESTKTSFPRVMNEIYDALKGVFTTINYGEICTNNIEQIKFNEMKLAYEYYMDHEKIKEQLGDDESGVYPCTVQYNEHVEKTFSAYNKVYASLHPGDGTDNAYCDKFEEMFNHYNDKNPQEIKCENVYTEKSLADIGTTAAISSILGVVGLPTMTFFLYKVSNNYNY